MDTVTSRLEEEAGTLAENLRRLLREHSGLLDVNSRSGSLIFIGNPSSWTKLDPEGIKLRGQLLRDSDGYINRASSSVVPTRCCISMPSQ